MIIIDVHSERRSQLISITDQVQRAVDENSIYDGTCVLYVPHTTAAVIINENADPDVATDVLMFLDELVPHDHPRYRHTEGNSDAHIKACFFGTSETLMIESGTLVLGTWQGIFFCEFDGPRHRKLHIQLSHHPAP